MKKIGIILLAIGFFSCEKEPVVVIEKADVIVIDVNNTTQYEYFDLSDGEQGGEIILNNHEGDYHFTSKHYGGKFYLVITTKRDYLSITPSISTDIYYEGNRFLQTVDGKELVKYKIYYE